MMVRAGLPPACFANAMISKGDCGFRPISHGRRP